MSGDGQSGQSFVAAIVTAIACAFGMLFWVASPPPSSELRDSETLGVSDARSHITPVASSFENISCSAPEHEFFEEFVLRWECENNQKHTDNYLEYEGANGQSSIMLMRSVLGDE